MKKIKLKQNAMNIALLWMTTISVFLSIPLLLLFPWEKDDFVLSLIAMFVIAVAYELAVKSFNINKPITRLVLVAVFLVIVVW